MILGQALCWRSTVPAAVCVTCYDIREQVVQVSDPCKKKKHKVGYFWNLAYIPSLVKGYVCCLKLTLTMQYGIFATRIVLIKTTIIC